MNENTPLSPLGPDQVVPSAPARRSDAERGAPDATFRMLLERLQARAEELEAQSQQVDDPQRLSGAVETARASLEEALSLSQELLEAFREASQQNDSRANDVEENDR